MKEIREQLNRIEGKLDLFSGLAIENKSDVSWIKGCFKVGVTVLIALVGGLSGYIIKLKG